MVVRTVRTYFLVPLIYIAVIFSLLYLQFGRRAEKFTDSFNDLQIVGTRSPDPKQKKITELHVRYQGIDFPFGERWNLEVSTLSGDTLSLGLVDYKKNERGFQLRFDREVSLDFSLDPKRNTLVVGTGKYLSNLQPKNLILRFSVVDGARANSVERMPIVSVKYKDKDYFLTLPKNSQVDMARQRFIIGQQPMQGILFTMAPTSTGTKDSFRQWYATQGSTTSSEVYNRRVEEYVSGAYLGWKSGRFQSETGTWITEKGASEFRETTAAALLAEAVRRNEYGTLLETLQKAAALHADQLTMFTSVYFGNLFTWAGRIKQDDEATSLKLLEQVRQKDLTVFLNTNLIQFAADRGIPQLWDELVRFASEVDLQQISLPVALGMLASYYNASTVDSALLKPFERFDSLINLVVFPAIVKVQDGFFLEWEQGKIDLKASIRAGKILLQAGNASRDEVLRSIGRDLIISALGLADRQGFLPQRILFSDESFKGTEGKIAPEDIYPLIQDNPFYPRFVSLSKELGRGTWLYIAADLSLISIQPEEWHFRFRFPVNEIHHFIFKGAKPYREIQIWGIPWRNDPRFERYPVGSFFLEDLGMFIIKYQHKKPEEEFLMRF